MRGKGLCRKDRASGKGQGRSYWVGEQGVDGFQPQALRHRVRDHSGKPGLYIAVVDVLPVGSSDGAIDTAGAVKDGPSEDATSGGDDSAIGRMSELVVTGSAGADVITMEETRVEVATGEAGIDVAISDGSGVNPLGS